MKRTSMTDIEIAEMVLRKLNGESWTKIAKAKGLCYQSMRRHIRDRLHLFKKINRRQQ